MAKIEMCKVDSGAISHMGYDPESRTLHVTFKNGDTYEHKDVPIERYASLTGAESIGGYYNTKIKPHHNGELLKNHK